MKVACSFRWSTLMVRKIISLMAIINDVMRVIQIWFKFALFVALRWCCTFVYFDCLFFSPFCSLIKMCSHDHYAAPCMPFACKLNAFVLLSCIMPVQLCICSNRPKSWTKNSNVTVFRIQIASNLVFYSLLNIKTSFFFNFFSIKFNAGKFSD